MTAKSVSQAATPPLPDIIVQRLKEVRWLLVIGVLIYLALILFGYDRNDPSWSHAVETNRVLNPGGFLGAWLSDFLLYLFGISAWWWVGLLCWLLASGYRHLDAHEAPDRGSLFVSLFGYVLLLLCSSSVEALRFHSLQAQLPIGPGGVLGAVVGELVARYLGFTGGTLILLGLLAVGWSLFSGMSWLALAERVGLGLEKLMGLVAKNWDNYQDRRVGQEVAFHRQETEQRVRHQRQEAEIAAQPEAAPQPSMLDTLRARTASLKNRVMESRPRAEAPELALPPDPPDFAPAPPSPAPVPDDDLPFDVPLPRKVATPAGPAARTTDIVMPPPAASFSMRQTVPSHHYGGAMPGLELLDPPSFDVQPPSAEVLEFTSRLIERRLGDFGVQVQVLAAYPGPVITRFEIEPAVGVKGAQILNLSKDLARALSVMSIRVVESIPGKSCMGLELPNPQRQTVRLSEILGSEVYQASSSMLTVALGKDIGGVPKVADLAKMPHLLVAGTTGSGKSVGINAMILSLLYKAEAKQVRLIMVDPKMLELSVYEGIPHLLAPVVTDMKQAANALNWCVGEMEKRYKLMSAMGVRNLAGFNTKLRDAEKSGRPLTNPFSITPESPEPLEELPFIVVVIDELADLMMVVGKKIEELIARLAQKARAAGIHLILATQRPSVDVITGLIKANVPTRIAFQVSSKVDSRTILDQMGAEALLGQGDMLYLAPGTGQPTRVHGAFVSDDEVHRVVQHLKAQGEPNYVEGLLEGGADGGEGGAEGGAGGGGGDSDGEKDALYDQAVDVVLKTRRASISLVQRHLRIGYNRAARLIEQMERSGLVSAMNGAGNRDVLAPAKEE